MKNRLELKLILFSIVVMCSLLIGMTTFHNMWIYAQDNMTQLSDQTGNQTGNQSLSPAIPGQQGGTPPKTGPS